ncbi:hypothetical protein [Paraclostridium sordellii]|uniref:hypothetical protein n=1 Tax=Paraclostridium sordellii TaxID=1505 RepID=UPI001C6155DC|nr:hypothetical protein [Paeniclostridium sordellii]QYE96678.1 hypothetical protein KZ987_10450 [Paeniclostridium sordellii]
MFYLDKLENVTLDVLENYLGVIELYNYSFDLENEGYSYDICIIEKENKSYLDVVKEYFCLEENEEIEFKLTELKEWKVVIHNWLMNHAYEAIISLTYEDKESCIKERLNKYSFNTTEKYQYSYLNDNEYIEFLNNDKLEENILSKTFVDLLENYMFKKPKKVFYFESNPNFFYECFWRDIVIECDDRFIFLHYGISD